jgi:hypothetical protein
MRYFIFKKIIGEELVNHLKNYFTMKKQVHNFLSLMGRINDTTFFIGKNGDNDIPNCYSEYSDFCSETLLKSICPKMEDKFKEKLEETYSYTRIYTNGSFLKKHKDRMSCEYSVTLNISGDSWPIYVEDNNTPIPIFLKPGDALFYKGCEINHWREPYTGKEDYIQIFLHYNKIGTNKYDNRHLLGLPKKF